MHFSRSIKIAGSPSMPSSLSCQEIAFTGHFMMHEPQLLQRFVNRVTRIFDVSEIFGAKRVRSAAPLGFGSGFIGILFLRGKIVADTERFFVQRFERRILRILRSERFFERLPERFLVEP